MRFIILSHSLSDSLIHSLSHSRSLPYFYVLVSPFRSPHTQTYITCNPLLRNGIVVACSHSDSSFCSNDDFGSPRATSSIVAWNTKASWRSRLFLWPLCQWGFRSRLRGIQIDRVHAEMSNDHRIPPLTGLNLWHSNILWLHLWYLEYLWVQ